MPRSAWLAELLGSANEQDERHGQSANRASFASLTFKLRAVISAIRVERSAPFGGQCGCVSRSRPDSVKPTAALLPCSPRANVYSLRSELLFTLQRWHVCHHGNAVSLEHHVAITLILHHPISSPFVDLEQELAIQQTLVQIGDGISLGFVAQVNQQRAQASLAPAGDDSINRTVASVPRRE